MNNQIILYENQKVDSLVYASSAFTPEEQNNFKNNSKLDWDDFTNPKIICNFEQNLNSSLLEKISDKITNYEISKKTPEEKFARSLGIFSLSELQTDEEQDNFYCIVDYNVKNNIEYSYFISPLTEDYIQTTLVSKVLTNWEVFSLTPIFHQEGDPDNKYRVLKDEFGEAINWIFHLNCSEGDITLKQDKTMFTTFASKPKISMGDLNYYTGSLSCLLGNVLYNDTYYEPNILLEKWNKMIKENHIYLFKNPKGDCLIVSLEEGTKRKYMNEVLNYYKNNYNGEIAITNRPTEIEFSYVEIMDSENIIVCGD